MFEKITKRSLSVLALIFLVWMVQVVYVRPSDKKNYQQFLQQKHEISSASKNLPETASQSRRGVRKDIWLAQTDGTRMHTRIDSVSSTLTLLPGNQKIDIIENLKGIRCWMHDKLYYTTTLVPMQQMRMLAAEEGTYQYTAQQFVAQKVALSVYKLPGHDLVYTPPSPFLKGIAKDVCFSISENSPRFQAQHFQASVAGDLK